MGGGQINIMRLLITALAFLISLSLFGQSGDVKMSSISESELLNCQNKYLEIQKSGISFINFYTYGDHNNGGSPVLFIESKESDVTNVLIDGIGCDGGLNFNSLKIGSFFDFNFWLIFFYNMDGGVSISLVNKSNNTESSLGYYSSGNILKDIVFYSNNYFIINYNNGCGAMNGCDHGFSLFKIDNDKIIEVFSTPEFFASNIKWQGDNILFIETKAIVSWDSWDDSEGEITFEKNFIQLSF
jgi:hypothetical protein